MGSLLPTRQFRQLNRARLDPATVIQVRSELERQVAHFVRAHKKFVGGGSVKGVTAAGQSCLNFLNDHFLVGAKVLVLRDSPRPHRRNRRGKIVYELHGDVRAVRGDRSVRANGRPRATRRGQDAAADPHSRMGASLRLRCIWPLRALRRILSTVQSALPSGTGIHRSRTKLTRVLAEPGGDRCPPFPRHPNYGQAAVAHS